MGLESTARHVLSFHPWSVEEEEHPGEVVSTVLVVLLAGCSRTWSGPFFVVDAPPRKPALATDSIWSTTARMHGESGIGKPYSGFSYIGNFRKICSIHWIGKTGDLSVCIGRCRVADAGPTVARRTLARLLRQRRESARITAAKAADHAGMHAGTISKIESAFTRVQPGTAQALMRFYGGSEEECEAVFRLAHAARRRGWWRSYKAIPSWFEPYVGLETEASLIREFQVELLPALLQTEEYAFALAKAAIGVSQEEAEERARLNTARQERLTSGNPPNIEVVIGEAALHRKVGSPKVMGAQLRKLRERCDLPNVSCHVLPFEVGEHPAPFGFFTILSFPQLANSVPTYGDVTYTEYGLGALYWEEPEEVAYYSRVFDELREKALSPKQSLPLVESALAEHE